MEFTKYDVSPMEAVGFFGGMVDDVQPVKPNEVGPHCYVAIESGEAVGMLLLQDDGYVTRIAVVPEHRREGVATRLFELAGKDFSSFRLECREDREAANEFYRQSGWAKTGERHGIDNDGNDLTLFEWEKAT